VFITSVLGGIVAAAVVAVGAQVFETARAGVPRLLGVVKLPYLRTAAAGVFGIAISSGISLSESNESHHAVTYIAWYAAAVAALVAAIVLTVVIDRGKAPSEPAPSEPVIPSLPGRPVRLPALSDREALDGERGRLMRHDLKPRARQTRVVGEAAATAAVQPAVAKRKEVVDRIKTQSQIADLRNALDEGRDQLERIDRPDYAIDSQTGTFIKLGGAERAARKWANELRDSMSDPTQIARFDAGADLPLLSALNFSGLATTSRENVVAFLRAKIHNLEQIVGALERRLNS